MTTGDFVPFGGDLGNQSTASFVRTGSGTPVDEAPSEIAPVTPAEANDLPGQIHQILQDHLSGESLENAAVAIQSAVEAAPARVALLLPVLAAPTPLAPQVRQPPDRDPEDRRRPPLAPSVARARTSRSGSSGGASTATPTST